MVGDGRRQDRLATWALIQGFGERECEPLSKRRYRIGDMALGSQRCVRCIPGKAWFFALRGAQGGNRRSFADEKSISGDAQHCVMVKAAPASALEMRQAEFALDFLVVAFDPPAQLGHVDEREQRGVFATKPALALTMIERATAAGVPFSFVAANTVYGVRDIEMALRRAGKGYVLGVKSNDPFRSWGKPRTVAGTAKEIADGLPASAWRRLSAGAGTKGERLHDWAYLELADLDGGEYNEALARQSWTRGLLIRRKIADGDLAFFTTWAPRGTTIERLAKIEGYRWAIEDSFETTKKELGLDHNETRSWHGWRRHVSLVMLAFAMMAAIRVHANTVAPPPKTMRRRTKTPSRTRR